MLFLKCKYLYVCIRKFLASFLIHQSGSIDLTKDDTPPFVDESEMPYDGNRDNSSDTKMDTIPCESCGKDIPWTDFEDHMVSTRRW